jgi:hypothetical protein
LVSLDFFLRLASWFFEQAAKIVFLQRAASPGYYQAKEKAVDAYQRVHGLCTWKAP